MERKIQAAFKIALAYTLIVYAVACSYPEGEFFYGALGLNNKRLLIASGNTSQYIVVAYDLEGHFVDVLWDSTNTNDIPRGLAPFNATQFALALDGADRLMRAPIYAGSIETLVSDSNLTGNLYQMVYNPFLQLFHVIETNTIEAFGASGQRQGNPFISATTGACVLNTSRGMAISSAGRLFVVGTGNDRVLVYDVTTSTPTCLTSNTALNATDPIAVLPHSNGLLYVATQGNDRVYSFAGDGTGAATVVWDTNTALINNPTALLELPDGTILVASDATNSIERMDTSGNLIGSGSFIRDAFTGLVNQMIIVGGEE